MKHVIGLGLVGFLAKCVAHAGMMSVTHSTPTPDVVKSAPAPLAYSQPTRLKDNSCTLQVVQNGDNYKTLAAAVQTEREYASLCTGQSMDDPLPTLCGITDNDRTYCDIRTRRAILRVIIKPSTTK